MQRSLELYLWDIIQAADNILAFTRDKQLSDYQNDVVLRLAVEPRFEVMGEALTVPSTGTYSLLDFCHRAHGRAALPPSSRRGSSCAVLG